MMKNKTNVKWKKRAATIVMSLCLLMGLMPIKVFAAGSSKDLPVYTIESEADGDYVKRDNLTATFTSSSTEFTLGAFDEYNNCARIDYYNPNRDDSGMQPDEGYDILVECNISLKFDNFTNDSISGEITIPLPNGYDGATAKIKDGVTATSSTETTVTFPVEQLEVSGDSAFMYALVEYKEKPQHTHSYGDWQKDETNHWRKCACGEKADSAAHSYDNDADTTCNVCGYVRTVKPQHTHSYGDWQKDETNHWRECACGEKADSAAHSYDNDADTTCNVCDYERTVTASTDANAVSAAIFEKGAVVKTEDGSLVDSSKVSVSVKKLGSDMLTKVQAALKNNETVKNLDNTDFYDISLLTQEGNVCRLESGKVQVTFKIKDGIDVNKYSVRVFHYNEIEQKVEELQVNLTDAGAVVEAESFSPFAVHYEVKGNVQTGDSALPMIMWFALAGCSLAGLSFLVITGRKRKAE